MQQGEWSEMNLNKTGRTNMAEAISPNNQTGAIQMPKNGPELLIRERVYYSGKKLYINICKTKKVDYNKNDGL